MAVQQVGHDGLSFAALVVPLDGADQFDGGEFGGQGGPETGKPVGMVAQVE
ncbi:hypothetical protein D3C72_2579540 [compost metagenome]